MIMHWARATVWFYVAAFGIIAVAETFLPFRTLPSSTLRRWVNNSVLFAVSSAIVSLIFRLSAVTLAFSIRQGQHGLLNTFLLPSWIQFVVGFAALDLAAYVSHRLSHAVSLMWRVHRVHHSETDLDLSTGFRFHPIEALFSQGLILAMVAILGPPAAATGAVVLMFIAQDFFSHSNLHVNDTANRLLRLVIITPAMHRVHHSVSIADYNKNFGTIFSFWDRIFGTYQEGHHVEQAASNRYGVSDLADGSQANVLRLIYMPFHKL